MVHSLLRRLTPAALFAVACAAQAQPAPAAARADPLDPQAKVPALKYESSLGAPRRSVDDKPVSWREANDKVARIGGWRVYAREAQQPEPAAPASSAAAKPMPHHGHAGHKTP
ncbi:MAG: hypothetical protein ABL916_19035 [Burkholderiaceae bacterium]